MTFTLLCQRNPHLHTAAGGGDRCRCGDFRDHPVLLEIKLQVDAVVEDIINRRPDAHHLLAGGAECRILVQFAVGSSIIAQAVK